MVIEALTPLDRVSCIKMYKNNTRSRLFCRIAKRSIAGSVPEMEQKLVGTLFTHSYNIIFSPNACIYIYIFNNKSNKHETHCLLLSSYSEFPCCSSLEASLVATYAQPEIKDLQCQGTYSCIFRIGVLRWNFYVWI